MEKLPLCAIHPFLSLCLSLSLFSYPEISHQISKRSKVASKQASSSSSNTHTAQSTALDERLTLTTGRLVVVAAGALYSSRDLREREEKKNE